MKSALIGLATACLLSATANVALAQDTTVIHKESADGERSKTVVKDADGDKTVIKRHGNNMKKVHTDAGGDETVTKKHTDADGDTTVTKKRTDADGDTTVVKKTPN